MWWQLRCSNVYECVWWLLPTFRLVTSKYFKHIKLRGDCLCHRSCIAPLWHLCWSLWLCSCRCLKRSAWQRENLREQPDQTQPLNVFDILQTFNYVWINQTNIECLCKVNMCINHFSQWRFKNFHRGHGKEPSNQRRRPRKTLFKALLYMFVTYSEYVCFEWTAAHHNNQNLLSDLGSAVRFWVKWPQVSLCHLHSATDVWSLMIVMETGSAGPVQRVNLRIRVQGSFKSPPTISSCWTCSRSTLPYST